MREPKASGRSSTRTEFVVVVRFRDDGGEFPCGPTVRKRQSLAAVRKYLTLIGPEPWNAYLRPGDGPDDYRCCSGAQCGCGGASYREEAAAYRAQKYPNGLPPIESVKVLKRTVARSAWEPTELAEVKRAE